MTLQPRPASEAASCDPYAVAARDPAARSCPWDGRSTGCGRPHGSCAVTAIRVCPEATILSRSVAEAQYPLARVAAVRCWNSPFSPVRSRRTERYLLSRCLTFWRMRGCRVRCVPTFVLRLIAPRPNFAQAMTGAEREIMSRHAARWRPYLERGDMVVFGPILTDDDSYGLAVVETDDDQVLRDFAAQDPVVTAGTAASGPGRMAAGHVRGR